MEPRPDSPDAAAPADAKSLVDPLLEAYAQGARALGQATPATLLDASDYATNAPYTAAPAPDKLALPDWDEQADEDAQSRHEQRSSAIRAKLKSQAMSADADQGTGQGTDQGEDGTGAPDTLDPGTASSVRARVKPFAATSGRRSSLLLTVAMAVLFAAGYLGVDYFLAQSQIPTARMQQARLSSPDVRATPAVASSKDAATFNHEPYDGARPDGATGMLPEAIGTARLRQAAANGDPLAQYEVASRFADGRGVAQDQTQAFAWYLRAAMHGFVPAQFRVAGLFERGLGVTADAERSKVWYRRAAEQGHVKAMHNLAVLSASRDANRGDFATAAEWFQQAAERGLTDSQYNLGLLYQKGLGVTKNLPASYLWFALAARGGDKEAAVRLEQVRAQMEPGALAAAEQQVADWRARSSPIGAGPEPAAAPIDDDAEVGG
jgi:localization factor PodJL